jgi:hypothetical protein
MFQDRDACFAQRNSIPAQQNSSPEQRNILPLAPDSILEQLSGVSRPLFMTKTAKFHQFRRFLCSLPSNHTHGDSHVTTLFYTFCQGGIMPVLVLPRKSTDLLPHSPGD